MTQMPIQSPSLQTVTAHRSSLTIRHAEFSSASHREPLLLLLRGQILKFAVKREQRKACLNFAEREQIERNQIQDDMMHGVRMTMERRPLAFLGLAIGC